METETVTAQSRTSSELALPSVRGLRNGWFLLVALGWVYGPTLLHMVRVWWEEPDYSHGLFIPFIALFFLWRKRHVLQDLPARPAAFGLVVVAGSQLVFLTGYLGAEFFLQGFSLLIFLVGLVLFLWGWPALRQTAFVLALLLLAIPLPAIIFNAVALPLQLTASSWAESILRLCHVPVYREGNILQLDRQMLNVTEACSGIRSLASLITAGMVVGYFLPARWWLRAGFVLSTVPVALAANAVRVAGTGVLGQHFGERWATGFFHLFSGWVIFVLAFGLLCVEWLLFQRWFGSQKSGVRSQEPEVTSG